MSFLGHTELYAVQQYYLAYIQDTCWNADGSSYCMPHGQCGGGMSCGPDQVRTKITTTLLYLYCIFSSEIIKYIFKIFVNFIEFVINLFI